MDTLLMAVTVISLAMASALAVLVLKLLHDERRRSEARVAVLAGLAGPPAAPVPDAATPPFTATSSGIRSTRYAHVPVAGQRVTRAPSDDLFLRSEPAPVTGVGELFASAERPSRWRARAGVALGLAAVVFALFFVMPRGSQEQAHDTLSVPVQAGAPSLELLSLAHTQSNGQFTISGIVANGREAATLSHLTAVATAFGPDGAMVASGRAAVDFTALQPGDESPFQITLSAQNPIARYRVGFRAEDGTPLAHLDRRQEK